MEPQPLPGETSQDWKSIAQDYLDRGDGFQAHMAASEGTHQHPGDAEAWFLRAQASVELDHGNDALFEVTEALRLDSTDPRFHCVLGDIHCGARDWVRARRAYEQAQALDPGSPLYAIGIANTYADNLELALPIYEEAVRKHPDNAFFREHLAAALADSITDQWSEFADDSRSITNEAQLDFSREMLARIAELDLRGEEFTEVRAHIAEIRRVVDRAAQVKWYGSDHMAAYLITVAVCVVTFLVAIGTGEGGLGVLAFLGIAGTVTGYVLRHRMPEWKWTRRSVSQSVRRSGRQPEGA
ncbi:lipopolysaccharide assembly protein LapB [Nocardia sp. BMG111209]|uniref:tetratricopeptide repeat protein n=1 Tax=Nocardia sp. BMG111209 TaxID=1160137 RepID=UPI00036EF7BF|nr:tetratricopeptide repeat protein [Nocardia sp. BMG111209]